MSLKVMSMVVELDIKNTNAKYVLFALAFHMNDVSGGCFPSSKRLRKFTGLSERSVFRSIKYLEDNGYIRVTRSFDEKGCAASNRYELLRGSTATLCQADTTPPVTQTEPLLSHRQNPSCHTDRTPPVTQTEPLLSHRQNPSCQADRHKGNLEREDKKKDSSLPLGIGDRVRSAIETTPKIPTSGNHAEPHSHGAPVERSPAPPPAQPVAEPQAPISVAQGNSVTTTPARKPRTPKAKNHAPTYTEAFEAFWRGYLRKTAKAAAFTAWGRLSEDDQQAATLAVQPFFRSRRDWGQDFEFAPHASTFLNQRRFDDFQKTTNGAGAVASTPNGNVIDASRSFRGRLTNIGENEIIAIVRKFYKERSWLDSLKMDLGPAPGMPGCRIPEEIIAKAKDMAS